MEREVYDRMRALEQRHWWFTARREILAAEIARLRLPPGARILEAGAGTGGNLALLQRFGAVEAVEPDASSRAYAAAQSGAPVHDGRLPDGLPDFGHAFDLIAAFDVIEHVDDDAAAVAALARRLAPGGRMIATVPAHAWLWSGHDAAHHHKRRYAMADYRRLFEATGLRVVRTSFFNTLLFAPIAAVRLAKAALRLGGGDEEALPPAPLNRLLHAVFASEATLLRVGDLPFGVSILLVAEAPA